jgi:hypothetical protein
MLIVSNENLNANRRRVPSATSRRTGRIDPLSIRFAAPELLSNFAETRLAEFDGNRTVVG